MRNYLLDIETVPLSETELLQLMPNHIANPVMPPEIANPVMPEELAPFDTEAILASPPNFMDGCPAYITKANPGGDPVKMEAYATKQEKAWRDGIAAKAAKIIGKRLEWEQKAEDKRMAWEERQIELKQKFIDDAALSAVTGCVKLIGLRDYEEKKTVIFIAGASAEQMAKLNAATYPTPVFFLTWAQEREMLSAFAHGVNAGNVIPSNDDAQSDFRLVGYYTHGFDIPFIFRRSWITGATAPYILRKGRYFNDAYSTDVHEVFQLGDKQVKTDGLDGLAKILGTKRKEGSGEGFHRLWNEDPVAAVLYLFRDLDVLEGVAEKMGIIHRPKPAQAVPMKGGK